MTIAGKTWRGKKAEGKHQRGVAFRLLPSALSRVKLMANSPTLPAWVMYSPFFRNACHCG